MQRDHLEAIQCKACGKWYAVRVQSADMRRHRDGQFAQFAFPYLPADLRELMISATCPACYARLCPDPITNPTAYN